MAQQTKDRIRELCKRPWASAMVACSSRQAGESLHLDCRYLTTVVNLSLYWMETPQGEDWWRHIFVTLKDEEERTP